MKKEFLEIGKAVGVHGIAGQIKVQAWCDEPQQLAKIKTLYLDENGKNAVEVIGAAAHKNVVLVKLKGVDTVEKAEAFRQKILFARRNDILSDENRWFIQDLLGCGVFDAASGEKLGVLTDVFQTGANDVWQVENNGTEYLVPVIEDVVVSVDIDNGKITINPLKGIFDNEN